MMNQDELDKHRKDCEIKAIMKMDLQQRRDFFERAEKARGSRAVELLKKEFSIAFHERKNANKTKEKI